MGTKITLSTLPISQYLYQSLFNVVCISIQSVFLFCFTLARTNHLLWTDPEVEPEGGPEVDPDGGPDGVEDPKTEGPKDRRTEGPKDRRTEGPKQ